MDSTTNFGTMSDSQLRQTINNLSNAAAGRPDQPHSKNYIKNIHQWSTSVTPPPKTPAPTATRSTRARLPRPAQVPTPAPAAPTYTQPVYQPPPPIPAPTAPPNPPRPPLPTATQALHSTYASRLRTGATLLVQPILPSGPSAGTSGGSGPRPSTRRGGVVNYADPGSGDDLPDAGALDSDDSDFVASGGTRTAVRTARSRMGAGMNVFHAGGGRPGTPQQSQVQQQSALRAQPEKAELDQSYLGLVPPARYVKPKAVAPTAHEYPTQAALEAHASRPSALVPIRVEFETDTVRVRDCFVWNVHEALVRPEAFARVFCADLELPAVPWVDTVATQIRAQIEEHEGVAALELQNDAMEVDEEGELNAECRVLLSIDVQIATFHLVDHIEWDLLSPLRPESFAATLCADLGLSGEAIPLVAHAVHEELVKHKKDALEWGVLGLPGGEVGKDRTGLSGGGNRPKVLKSVWRDWAEVEEFGTKFEVLSAEEVERREVERERASRRLRRETSKFQSSTRTRRR